MNLCSTCISHLSLKNSKIVFDVKLLIWKTFLRRWCASTDSVLSCEKKKKITLSQWYMQYSGVVGEMHSLFKPLKLSQTCVSVHAQAHSHMHTKNDTKTGIPLSIIWFKSALRKKSQGSDVISSGRYETLVELWRTPTTQKNVVLLAFQLSCKSLENKNPMRRLKNQVYFHKLG